MPDSDTLTETRRSVDRDLRRDYRRVRRFFPGGDPREATVLLPERAGSLGQYLSAETLAAVRQYNQAHSCGDLTLRNIELLGRAEVNVVVATISPNFLTGPLRDIYKVLTCIGLAAYCRETLGLRTVPVCWLATGQPQTPHAREVRVVNAHDQVVALFYEPEAALTPMPVGDVPLEPQVDFQLRLLGNDTASSDFKRYLTDMLVRTRERSGTLGEWSARLLHALFHIYGLVVIDENEAFASRQAARCLTEPHAWGTRPARTIAATAAELAEQQYPPDPVTSAETLPFALWDAEGLEEWTHREGRFESSHGRTLDADAMREHVARRHTDVRLANWIRPVVQASWLPVLATVVDGPEARMHAQIADLYEAARLPAPMVFPRARVALMERHIQRVLEKYHLALTDFVQSRKVLTDRALAADVPRPVIAACDRKLDVIQAVLDELREEVADSNPEFTERLDRIKRDLGVNMEELRRELLDAKTESPYIVSASLERARAHLFPEGRPQEQVLNIFPYLFTHGIQLVSRLSTEIDVFKFDVQVVQI